MVRQWQELLHGEPLLGNLFGSLPDFVKLAEAYGATASACADPATSTTAIEEMIDTPRAVIVDCLVDKQENCFPMIPSGKAHNQMILADDADVELETMIDAKGRELV